MPIDNLENAFNKLFSQLKKVDGAVEVVKAVVGGVPASLKQIEKLIEYFFIFFRVIS